MPAKNAKDYVDKRMRDLGIESQDEKELSSVLHVAEDLVEVVYYRWRLLRLMNDEVEGSVTEAKKLSDAARKRFVESMLVLSQYTKGR